MKRLRCQKNDEYCKHGWKKRISSIPDGFIQRLIHYYRLFVLSIFFCWTWPNLAAATPWSAPVALSPTHCALRLIVPRTLVPDLPVAQDAVEGGVGSAATLGLVANSTEPVAVAVPELSFFIATPICQRTRRVLSLECEGRRPGRRRGSLRCQQEQWLHRWQRPRERRTVAPVAAPWRGGGT